MIVDLITNPVATCKNKTKFSLLYQGQQPYSMLITLADAEILILNLRSDRFTTEIRHTRSNIHDWTICWRDSNEHCEVDQVNNNCKHNLQWKVENIIYDEFTFQREDEYGTQFIHALRTQSPLINTNVRTHEGHQALGLELGQNNLIMYGPDIQVLPLTPSVPEIPCKKKRKHHANKKERLHDTAQ